jgi:hypothetical protein
MARARKPLDHEILRARVEASFQASGRTRFPTVATLARELHWRRSRIADAVEGDPDGQLYTTSFHTLVRPPYGEHFVETFSVYPPSLPPAHLRP